MLGWLVGWLLYPRIHLSSPSQPWVCKCLPPHLVYHCYYYYWKKSKPNQPTPNNTKPKTKNPPGFWSSNSAPHISWATGQVLASTSPCVFIAPVKLSSFDWTEEEGEEEGAGERKQLRRGMGQGQLCSGWLLFSPCRSLNTALVGGGEDALCCGRWGCLHLWERLLNSLS